MFRLRHQQLWGVSMGIRTIVLIITILFFQLPQAIAGHQITLAKKRSVYIVLEMADPANPDGDVMTRMGQFINALEYNMYAKDIILIVAESKEDITRQLQSQLQGNVQVTGMLVTAHGLGLKKDLDNKNQLSQLNKNTIKKNYSMNISSISSHETVDLLDTTDTQKIFAPLLNKWSRNPRLTFFSCALLGKGHLTEKFIMTTIVADNLNIKNGQIYMNETDGAAMIRRLGEPAYDMPTTEQTLQQLGNHAIFYVTYPYALYQDRVASNKGYRLVRTAGTNYFYHDRYFNAEKAEPPIGPLIEIQKDEWFD